MGSIEPLSDNASYPEMPISKIDKKDVGTPDEWIPRHPDLIRLTGRHPLNCEPPLTKCYELGFLTPASLHFVRNHGAVPKKLDWDTHTIKIHGAVDKPLEITMAQLTSMPSVKIPVTLVCAGNRRREENMIKKTIGFSWGACAVSTSVWTGVRLCDLLREAGVRTPEEGARHVCFVGRDELPKDRYGTSMSIIKAMDPASDVLIAWEQNGKRLLPDHGYPVRLIIPGWIGGRMVKWLTDIEVTANESNNYYHYFDNRVLPSHVDAEKATAEGWWYKPEYIINDLNINSAMVYPQHDEILKLNGRADQTYALKGYAYSGGGRRVIRVEVSFDEGKVWNLANIKITEKPNAYGKYWCWIFWDLEVNVSQFIGCKEIALRAWDEGMNTQPKDITWNVMGMMNNCHFRVKIHSTTHEGYTALKFEHPTVAANGPGGWMVPEQKKELAPAQSQEEGKKERGAAAPAGQQIKTYTMEEVSKHDHERSAWFVHDGKVYDATPYLKDHPGGPESILLNAGIDATEEFDAIHSTKARDMLKQYYIGDLDTSLNTKGEDAAVKREDLVALNPKKRIPFKLVEKEILSHDTRRFRFALQSDKHVLGLPVGNHMLVAAKVNEKLTMRAYTPTSSNDDIGYFDLVIKVYFKNVHPKFPEGGVLSQHFDTLKIGDEIEVKGPLGHVSYMGKGDFILHGKPEHLKNVGLLAGGTGITPCYQIIKAILKDPEDETRVFLLYANKTEEDILLRKELDALAAAHPKKFKLHYTLDKSPKGWAYSEGHINQEMLKETMPPSSPNTKIMMCGPPPMLNYACIPNLQKNGYAETDYLNF